MGQVVWPWARVATALAITLRLFGKSVVFPENVPSAFVSHICTAGCVCWHCTYCAVAGSVVEMYEGSLKVISAARSWPWPDQLADWKFTRLRLLAVSPALRARAMALGCRSSSWAAARAQL